MAFHPPVLRRPGYATVPATTTTPSGWRTAGPAAAQQIDTETRKQPELEQEIELQPDIRVITPPGGILMFSGAQLHTTVPNTSGKTRFSIDFRTVNRNDVEPGAGARNVDSECTGTTLGDFSPGQRPVATAGRADPGALRAPCRGLERPPGGYAVGGFDQFHQHAAGVLGVHEVDPGVRRCRAAGSRRAGARPARAARRRSRRCPPPCTPPAARPGPLRSRNFAIGGLGGQRGQQLHAAAVGGRADAPASPPVRPAPSLVSVCTQRMPKTRW